MILLLIAFSAGAYAQFNTGSVYFSGTTGGNLGIGIFESQVYIPLELGIEGGYFIKNKLSVGAEVHTHGELFFGGGSTFELRLGPTIRYYRPSAKDLQLFYLGHLYYGFWEGSNNQTGIEAGVGADYFLTERVAIEAKVLYHYQRQWSNFGGFSFTYNYHDLLFEIGISVFFPSLTFFDKS